MGQTQSNKFPDGKIKKKTAFTECGAWDYEGDGVWRHVLLTDTVLKRHRKKVKIKKLK